MTAPPKITVKGSVTKVLIKGAMVVCVATSGFTIISQYISKPVMPKTVTSSDTNKTIATMNIIYKNALTYDRPKVSAKPFLFRTDNKEGAIGMAGSNEFHNLTSDTAFLPVHYAGKLPVGSENNFTLNNDREKVDRSHSIEIVTMPVSYGGRLPVGRERS